jgi:hypothetical protein
VTEQNIKESLLIKRSIEISDSKHLLLDRIVFGIFLSLYPDEVITSEGSEIVLNDRHQVKLLENSIENQGEVLNAIDCINNFDLKNKMTEIFKGVSFMHPAQCTDLIFVLFWLDDNIEVLEKIHSQLVSIYFDLFKVKSRYVQKEFGNLFGEIARLNFANLVNMRRLRDILE